MACEEADGDSRSYFRTPTPACDLMHERLAEKIQADEALSVAMKKYGPSASDELLAGSSYRA